jgi:cytosine/adenosine deaminase-related metal-dependent hydrolase
LRLILRNARLLADPGRESADLAVVAGRVADTTPPGEADPDERAVDLAGRFLLPGLVNAHDVLDLAVVPALGHPPYANLYDWITDTGRDPRAHASLALPLPERLFLGGLRNLLAGVTAVAHHNPDHRLLHREDFPVFCLARYDYAHSPGLTPNLRKAYRTTDRRIPWLVRAAAGTDERAAGELEALAAANVLRQNTVLVHGTALRPADAVRLAEARASVVWCPEADGRLFGAQPPVRALLEAGVPLGLGTASPACGVRDALSNLAAARATGLCSDAELIELATRGSAETARLPLGGLQPGDAADLLAVTTLDDLLAGRRPAISLVLRGGQPIYGEKPLLEGLGIQTKGVIVDGAERAIAARLGRRAATLSRKLSSRPPPTWLEGVAFPP